MLRKTRIAVILIFIMAVIGYGAFTVYEKKNADQTRPEFEMDSPSIVISVNDEESAIFQGVTAYDEKDGDVSENLIVESLSNFYEKGKRTAYIAVFDNDGHVNKITRDVIYEDYEEPVFELTAPFDYPVRESASAITIQELSEKMSVVDSIDGDISESLRLSSDYILNAAKAGEYHMEFQATNSAGYVSNLPVTVRIYDEREEAKSPSIELTKYLINVEKGTDIDPGSYVKSLQIDGIAYTRGKDSDTFVSESDGKNTESLTVNLSDVSIDASAYDKDTYGTYEIQYHLTDPEGEIGVARLYVVVREDDVKISSEESGTEKPATQEGQTEQGV